MLIDFHKALVAKVGYKNLTAFGLPESDKDWKGWTEIDTVDLSEFKPAQLQELIELLRPFETTIIDTGTKKKDRINGTKMMIKDIEVWLRALTGEEVKARTVKHFQSLLHLHLVQRMRKNLEEGRPHGPRLYRMDPNRRVWAAYYVERTTYHKPTNQRGDKLPPYVRVDLQWREFGGDREIELDFYADSCLSKTVSEALQYHGFVVETAELWADYEDRMNKFKVWQNEVGRQFLARGSATDDCDGNSEGRSNSWWWRKTNTIDLEKTGEPSRVVVDVFYEDEDKARDSRKNYDKMYWVRGVPKEDDDDNDYDAPSYDETPEPYRPTHMNLACFDLKRHMRLRIDVGQLEPYKYDAKLGDKLVLPDDSRNLIDMLMRNRGTFTDVIKGKSGGSIILSAGAPGTGKTLTAEVYTEVMGKPLYTVQASQLGLRPEELEEALLKCFARAQRWDAILLIDEADVYVAARGRDLQQNAIVGVFLRVLEYYAGVLFLTTNRSDLVDDAIASRCIARIDYTTPTQDDQRKIWNVLSATAGITIAPSVIDEVVELYPDLSGRDVKNLLKLSQLVANHRRCDITVDVIRFVKRFKPTGTYKPEDEPINLPEVRKLQRKQTNG